MSKGTEEDWHTAITFTLAKLRRLTLEGYKFGQEYYPFEFYDLVQRIDVEAAGRLPVVAHEIQALVYLDQKGVIDFTEGSEVDESIVANFNEDNFQQELVRFGLIDKGTSIQIPKDSLNTLRGKPTFRKGTDNLVYKGLHLLLPRSTKQHYVVKLCLANWGKPVPELDVIEILEANHFDVGDRFVRDSVPRLNRKFQDAFQIEDAFTYSGDYIFIDSSKFETV